MRLHLRQVLLGAAFVVAFTLSAATAHASTGITKTGGIFSASGRLTINASAVCDVTMNITDTTTVMKVTRRQQGTVDRVTYTNCSGGGMTDFVALVPMAISYLAFVGTLPRPLYLRRLYRYYQRQRIFADTCLYEGDLEVQDVFTGDELTSLVFTGGRIPRTSGGVLCPATISVAGTLAVAGIRPRFRLI